MFSSRIYVTLITLIFSTYVGAVDPFAQQGGLFSFSISYLSETDDISLLARDRAAPEIVLDTTKSVSLKGSLRLLKFLYIYGEKIDSEWEEAESAGIDFDTNDKFEKSQSGTGIGIQMGRYTLEVGMYKIEDVIFYIDAVGTNRYSEYKADRLKFELSYLYRMSKWLGVNFGVSGWKTSNPDLDDSFELEDAARMMKMGIQNSFGLFNIGFNYHYGFKEYDLQIENVKSVEKVYYSAYELRLSVQF